MRRALALAVGSAAALCVSGGAFAAVVSGHVRDAAGKPVPFVRINIDAPGGTPATTSVFSVEDGSFASPALSADVKALQINAFRIGWEESGREVVNNGDDLELAITVEPIENVAHQVPASAWVPGEPGTRPFHMLVSECSNCHQVGAERVRRFSRAIDGAPPESKQIAWEAIIQYMRAQALRMGPSGQTELRWGLAEDHPDYQMAVAPETSFFTPRDMELVVPVLANDFPTRFDELTGYDDVKELGEFGVTKATVVEEYALPSFGWTREVAIAPGSDKVWFLELDADRIGALDTATGAVEWYEVPGEGPQGPHTVNADSKGGLWIALEESYGMARFDTATKEWRVYPPPEGLKFAITHDAAFNAKRQVEPDAEGKIWLTLVGINELWSIHVDTGAIERFPMPIPEEEQAFHAFLYGAALDPNGKRVWWTQLHGYLGAFNTETKEVEKLVEFPRGAMPRRLAIDDDGTLWVPLFGEGQLMKYDTAAGKELARYDMPDRAGATYSVTLDQKRDAIWLATTNSDRIYRFDVADERWRQYPLPRPEAYLRSIELDHATGDLWTAYSNLPIGKRDPVVFGTEDANNRLVRLRPGD